MDGNRNAWLKKAEQLMDFYCNDCFLHQQNKRDMGKRGAHRFCIKQCTVGQRIKKAGDMLGQKLTED